MSKKSYRFWFNEMNKVIPIHKMDKFFVIFIFIVFIFFLLVHIYESKKNWDFYYLDLKTIIIDTNKNGSVILLKSNHELKPPPSFYNISLGDSVIKNSKSWEITIKRDSIIWQKKVPTNIKFNKQSDIIKMDLFSADSLFIN